MATYLDRLLGYSLCSVNMAADLRAKNIKIHGAVNGYIQGSEMVVVSKTGKVLGNTIAPRVTLEDGA